MQEPGIGHLLTWRVIVYAVKFKYFILRTWRVIVYAVKFKYFIFNVLRDETGVQKIKDFTIAGICKI